MFGFKRRVGRGAGQAKPDEDRQPIPMSRMLKKNIEQIQAQFCDDNDFINRQFELKAFKKTGAAIFYIDGLASSEAIHSAILTPLMIESRKIPDLPERRFYKMEEVCDLFLPSGEVEIGSDILEACNACLLGDTVLMIDGIDSFAIISTKGFEKRAITEPETENVLRGPREGFTESLRTNTSLLRRKLTTPNLRMETITVGRRSKTTVCLTYIDNLANPELIKEVKKRLSTINTDAILSGGALEDYIEDAPSSVFRTINFTEKPDIVAARLLEGRCALIVDGTPFALTMPMLFMEGLQSPEDYASRTFFATFSRILRVVSFLLAIISPAAYIALTSFHQDLIPTSLLFTISAATEKIPFGTIYETALMLFAFEVLKEAGIRLPQPIGQAVSIVGALVVGQAAIDAGLVGAPVVIVTAFTAVCTFVVPNLSDAVSILRWFLLIAAGVMGGLGISMGLIGIMVHLASLESFGSHYLYPYSPFDATDMKDTIIRKPLWKLRTRPADLNPQDIVRQSAKKPEFGEDGEEQ